MKAVIFDMDGVVVDSEPIIFEAAALSFKEYGIVLQKEDVQGGIGAGPKYMSDPMMKYGLEGVSIEDLIKSRQENIYRLAPGRMKPFPGFFELMSILKERRLKTALASSASTKEVYFSLEVSGIDPKIFDRIVDSSLVKNKKPAPDIFLQAAKDLRADPAECLVLEDSPAGVEAAHRAGMKVIGVASTVPAERLAAADQVVACLSELMGSKLLCGNNSNSQVAL